jgi:DNA-binding transcriptional ArsR family regulator
MAAADCTDILKALADRTRQRIVKALVKDARSVNDLTEQLGLSQYNTSKHLRVFKQAGIVG